MISLWSVALVGALLAQSAHGGAKQGKKGPKGRKQGKNAVLALVGPDVEQDYEFFDNCDCYKGAHSPS